MPSAPERTRRTANRCGQKTHARQQTDVAITHTPDSKQMLPERTRQTANRCCQSAHAGQQTDVASLPSAARLREERLTVRAGAGGAVGAKAHAPDGEVAARAVQCLAEACCRAYLARACTEWSSGEQGSGLLIRRVAAQRSAVAAPAWRVPAQVSAKVGSQRLCIGQ